MKKPNEVIILGGGMSIREGISLGLVEQLKNKCVLACNYSFLHFPHTTLVFTDSQFYSPSAKNIKEGKYPDLREELKKEPMILCGHKNDGLTKENVYPNTRLLNLSSTYHGSQGNEKGFYNGINFPGGLCGLVAMSIAACLLQERGSIFLLGFDFSTSGPTHYYTDIKHRGQGKTKAFENANPKQLFSPYEKSITLDIYNVSPKSNIPNFLKIDYPTFFKMLSPEIEDQNELRRYFKHVLY
jgi:hypothetical protein